MPVAVDRAEGIADITRNMTRQQLKLWPTAPGTVNSMTDVVFVKPSEMPKAVVAD